MKPDSPTATPEITVALTIDGRPVAVLPGQSVLEAARSLQIDIPTLCYLEECGPLNSCLVCLVKINGKLVPSCGTKAQPGMVVESDTAEVHEARKTALELLFSDHVGDCLSPCHRLCPLRMNVPVMLRQIQGGKLDEATVTVRDALPLASVLGRLCHHPCEQGCRRGTWDDAAAIRDLERMVADRDLQAPDRYLPPCKPATGKSVVVIGSGPAGLAAAFHLLREGHACTIADRQQQPGGTLRRAVETSLLPGEILDAEIAQLGRLGAQFKMGVVLGTDITLDGLLRGFDAVLLTVGEVKKTEVELFGVDGGASGIKTHPDTCQTSRLGVFAAGRAVRSTHQIIRAMSDGQTAAECIDLFLREGIARRREKTFSNVMGRLEDKELRTFVESANTIGSVWACDACAGFSRDEAASEASRCVHCDCRSSGSCGLQHYAQAYHADPGRFRQKRRPFEQSLQPQGVVFEPGKCILCGICVKLTELAREPLGLTFIGRGFDVKVAAPFNESIQEGLKKTATECVKHCPTGALAFVTPPAPE